MIRYHHSQRAIKAARQGMVTYTEVLMFAEQGQWQENPTRFRISENALKMHIYGGIYIRREKGREEKLKNRSNNDTLIFYLR